MAVVKFWEAGSRVARGLRRVGKPVAPASPIPPCDGGVSACPAVATPSREFYDNGADEAVARGQFESVFGGGC